MPARTLMIQGTGSHVGKSVLVAALCRLFVSRGLRVAPFKAQNMSNNSFVTPDGKEIGRAQAVQAAACRVPPRSDFNPILIKPSGEQDAQLVVNGEVAGRLTASDFGRIKREFEGAIRASFDRLRDEFDLIVLEGAGSPAEVNLRDHDVVNMHMAKIARAPVILIGDIDRGGVLASLVGTMMLLTEDERQYVKGFLVNKFRGDVQLLSPGIQFVEGMIQRPCLGVVPYYRAIQIPEEDALAWERFSRASSQRSDILTVGVVDVPCLSNFTDIDAFVGEPDVRIQRVTDCHSPIPDILIFPGTKHTMQALMFVRERKLDQLAGHVLRQGGTVVGICGGYQILGRFIRDPKGVESSAQACEGLGLLDVVTTFESNKVTVQVAGCHKESGLPIEGYEVHMGQTVRGEGLHAFVEIKDTETGIPYEDGAVSSDRRIVGTYVHGLFDGPAFRRYFLNAVRARRGWSPLDGQGSVSLDENLDRWAECVASSLDMTHIEQIIQKRV